MIQRITKLKKIREDLQSDIKTGVDGIHQKGGRFFLKENDGIRQKECGETHPIEDATIRQENETTYPTEGDGIHRERNEITHSKESHMIYRKKSVENRRKESEHIHKIEDPTEDTVKRKGHELRTSEGMSEIDPEVTRENASRPKFATRKSKIQSTEIRPRHSRKRKVRLRKGSHLVMKTLHRLHNALHNLMILTTSADINQKVSVS